MRRLLLGCICFLLAGCAGMNTQFTCPQTPGVMCQDLDTVNAMVDAGVLGKKNLTSTQSSHPSYHFGK